MNGPNRYIGSEYPLLFMDPEKEDAKGEGNKFRNDIYQYIWDFNLKKHSNMCRANIGSK